MKDVDPTSHAATVSMSRDELRLVANALNEAIEFVPRTEFMARLGQSREAAISLLKDIQQVLNAR